VIAPRPCRQRGLIRGARGHGDGLLRVGMRVDRAAVVAADVVALAVALRRVMVFPEAGEHVRERDLGSIERYLDDFGVVPARRGAAAQRLLVVEDRFVLRSAFAIRVTDFDVDDAGQRGHALFRSPEAAHAEHDRVDRPFGGKRFRRQRGRRFRGAGGEHETRANGGDHAPEMANEGHGVDSDQRTAWTRAWQDSMLRAIGAHPSNSPVPRSRPGAASDPFASRGIAGRHAVIRALPLRVTAPRRLP
jgi:hypothetical protein